MSRVFSMLRSSRASVRGFRALPASGAVARTLLWMLVLLAPTRIHAAAERPGIDGKPTGSVLAQYVQTAITSHNGLPENTVRSIAQSVDGYIWLATEEGLVRYDGTHTRVFDLRTDPMLRDNFIQTLSAAPDGSVWLTNRSGVSRYAHGVILSHAPSRGVTLTLVFCDSQGTVWVGTDTGLYTVATDGGTLVPFAGIAQTIGIRAMAQSHNGSLWVATTAGMWHIEHGKAHRHGASEGVPEAEIKRMALGNDDSLWMSTDAELIHWKCGVLQRIPVNALATHGRVTALLVDGSRVWIGMMHDGIVVLEGNHLSHYRASDGLPIDDVEDLQKDRDGNLWMAFNGSGAVRFHAGLFTTYGDREGMTESSVFTARTAPDGSVWASTHELGLNHLFPDGHVERIGAAQGLPTGLIYSLFVDRDSSLWVGLDIGDLVHIQGKHVTVLHDPAHLHDQLRCILRGPDGDLFLLYHAQFGLVRFRDGTFTNEQRNIPGLPTTAAQAPDGSLWIGTDNGGVVNWNHRILQLFGSRQGFSAEFAKAIAVDQDGTVWVGSSPAGLSRIRGGQVTTYLPQNGLFDYTVGSVTDDHHGYLWMTSNKGIFKVSKQELNDVAAGRATSIHSIVYGVPDGMRNAECNYDTNPAASLAPDGRVWFATLEGLVSVVPGASTIRSSQPNALIDGAVVDGKRLKEPSVLQTTVGAHDVEFDFNAPDFTAPERLHFRYRLQGFDRDWNDAGDRQQAFYTRLPPGSYTLVVQAEDGSGWSSQSAVVKVVVPPHFWQTMWFRGLASLLVLLLGWGIYTVRTVALRRSQRILQEQVIVRTAELQAAMRDAEVAHYELQELATRDSMTRLWNRRHILNMLSNESNRAERENLSLCVLLLDVDHFKQVNDTRGHLAGDRVLQAVANVLIDQTRPYDCAGRYGGEEFLVVLCNCTLENGLKRANMIREAIARTSVDWNGQPIGVTASFGVTMHVPGKTIEAVLDEADRALYRAKQIGRNRVCCPAPVAQEDLLHVDATSYQLLAERSAERLAALRSVALKPA